MKKILSIIALTIALLGATLVAPSPAGADVQERKNCSVVKNDYAGYDEFDVYAAGPRFNGVNTWRTAIIATYKSCARTVKIRRIGVEFRHISSRGTNDKCESIRDFTANLTVAGFNPGPATTDCNGQDSRFILWYPVDSIKQKRSTNREFRDIAGTWTVDVFQRRDNNGSYSRLYPRFGG